MVEYKLQYIVDNFIRYVQSNLENYTTDTINLSINDDAQNAPKGESTMAQNRVRVMIGNDEYGLPKYTWVGGKTQDERNDNIVKEYYVSGRLWQVIGVDPLQIIAQAGQRVQLTQSSTTPTRVSSSGIARADANKHPFREYAWSFFERYKVPKLSENSKTRERTCLNVLCAAFEDQSIEDITVDDVQDFINARASAGTSTVTITDNIKCLRQILNSAVEDKLRSDNPAKSSKISINGRETNGTESLSLSCIKSILSHIPFIQDKRIQLFLALLCYTGMRREEVLGLQWRDIDYTNNRIHVQRAITYPRGVRIIKGTKSKAGNRYIPVPDKLVLLLKAYPKANTEYKDYVLLNERGELFSDRGVDKLLADLRQELKMDGITAKTFRTTFATMMVASNKISVKELQNIMGHSKIETTLEIYAKVEHTILSAKRNTLVDFLETVSALPDSESTASVANTENAEVNAEHKNIAGIASL